MIVREKLGNVPSTYNGSVMCKSEPRLYSATRCYSRIKHVLKTSFEACTDVIPFQRDTDAIEFSIFSIDCCTHIHNGSGVESRTYAKERSKIPARNNMNIL